MLQSCSLYLNWHHQQFKPEGSVSFSNSQYDKVSIFVFMSDTKLSAWEGGGLLTHRGFKKVSVDTGEKENLFSTTRSTSQMFDRQNNWFVFCLIFKFSAVHGIQKELDYF